MMIKTFNDLLSFFKERQKLGIKPGLERVEFLLEELEHPEAHLQAVHVAGTNGKGSTIQYLKEALIASGHRVGVFTSPSFSGVTGHFVIDHEEISEEELVSLLNDLLPAIQMLDQEGDPPTEYEILTVMALLYFKNHVDIALIETAMGGRFDTTNPLIPTISLLQIFPMTILISLGKVLRRLPIIRRELLRRSDLLSLARWTRRVRK